MFYECFIVVSIIIYVRGSLTFHGTNWFLNKFEILATYSIVRVVNDLFCFCYTSSWSYISQFPIISVLD